MPITPGTNIQFGALCWLRKQPEDVIPIVVDGDTTKCFCWYCHSCESCSGWHYRYTLVDTLRSKKMTLLRSRLSQDLDPVSSWLLRCLLVSELAVAVASGRACVGRLLLVALEKELSLVYAAVTSPSFCVRLLVVVLCSESVVGVFDFGVNDRVAIVRGVVFLSPWICWWCPVFYALELLLWFWWLPQVLLKKFQRFETHHKIACAAVGVSYGIGSNEEDRVCCSGTRLKNNMLS